MDLDCYEDVSLFGLEVDDPVIELGQDLYHRLIESPGSNPDDIDRGCGISDRLSGPLDVGIGAHIAADFRKDGRVASAKASIEALPEPNAYRVDILVTPVDFEPFVLSAIRDSSGTVTRLS